MLVRRPPADYLAFARGILALSAAQVGIALNRVPACAAALGVPVAGGNTARVTAPPPPAEVERASRVARRLASAFGERNHCLRHSLVMGHLLRAHSPVLCFGVRRENSEVVGHAWVEVGGAAVGRYSAADTGAFVLLRRAS